VSGDSSKFWVIGVIAIVAALGYRAAVFREAAVAPPARILFISGGEGPYWQASIAGAKAAAKVLNVDLTIETPEKTDDLDAQMAILRNVDTKKADGIALSPLDPERQTHQLNDIARQFKLVTYDSDAPLSERHNHIGTSNFSAGRTCARLVGEALPDGGKVAVIMANNTKANMIERRGGFAERMGQLTGDSGDGTKTPKYTVVGYYEDLGNNDTCIQLVRDVVTKEPELGCILALNARHGPLLIKELTELGKLDQIKLVTFDATDETLKGIEEGHIYATIAQDPYNYGFEAVSMLAALCRGEETNMPIVGRGSVYVGAEAIKQDNLADYRKRLQAREDSADKKAKKKATKAA
jgi:ribose transport system substrate-binding protein